LLDKIATVVDRPVLVVDRHIRDKVEDFHLDRKNGWGVPSRLYSQLP